MSMFCGLPVMLATLPMLDPVATASRYASGDRPMRRVMCSTNGTITRQMMSFTKNAESTPLVKITAGSRCRAPSRSIATSATASKKPNQVQVGDNQHHREQQDQCAVINEPRRIAWLHDSEGEH